MATRSADAAALPPPGGFDPPEGGGSWGAGRPRHRGIPRLAATAWLRCAAAAMLLGVASVKAAPPAEPAPVPASGVPLPVVRRAMLDDPNLLAKVAARNGMTPARFMGQEEGRIMQMVRVYLAERRAAPAASSPR